MDPTSIGIILAACAVTALGFYLLKKNRESSKWGMDPRLKPLAEWAYACMLDVTGLDDGYYSVPNVKGIDSSQGDNVWGTFYMPSRSIKVTINRPYEHLVNIMLHEMGHDGDWRLHGKSTGEDYANWVNEQCLEKNRPDFYPAPKVRW